MTLLRDTEEVPLEIENASVRVADALEHGASLTAATAGAAIVLGNSGVGRAFATISADLAGQVHPWKAFATHAELLGLSVVEPLMNMGGSPRAFRDTAKAARAIAELRMRRRASAAGSHVEEEALEVCVMLAHALESSMPLGSAFQAAGARIGGARCDWAIAAGDHSLVYGDVERAFEAQVPMWFRDVVVRNVGFESLASELRRLVVDRTRPAR